MNKLTEICDFGDVVLVPFPFVDMPMNKKRPALVLSSYKNFNIKSGACIMTMVTTKNHSPWPFDTEIIDFIDAGLSVPSIIRMKLFTLDKKLIIKKLGSLSKRDCDQLVVSLQKIFP